MRILWLSLTLVLAACSSTDQRCAAATCAGCCAADGTCELGSTNDACGSAGLSCEVCSATSTCQSKRCVPMLVDAGSVGSDAGSARDGGMLDGGIDSPPETWTWVDFPGSACGNGVATGLGLNRSTKSGDLLIYLQGGGACWDTVTCDFGAAANISTGYTATTWASDATKDAPPLNRSLSNNPFKDMSYVIVPYCTGDVHAGDAVQNYPALGPQFPAITVHHKGRRNLQLYLERLHATFPDARRVFLAGSSAGGFGTQLTFELVRSTWPSAEVHALVDCAQMLNPSGTLYATWLANWNLEVPSDCTDCRTDFTKFPGYLHAKYPQSRFALLGYLQDNVLTQFFSLNATQFSAQSLALGASSYDPFSNAKYFFVDQANHVMLFDLFTLQGPGGATLLDFTTKFETGSSTWTSVKP